MSNCNSTSYLSFLAPKQGSLLHFLQRTERGRYIYPLGANERYKAFYRGETSDEQ